MSAAVFVLYLVLAARDVMFGDGPELTAAAIDNTVAHPPGYPLWIVLGHLAALIPLGAPAFRVNATASFYHALTAGIVYLTAFALVRRQLAALFAAVLVALDSPLYVSWSLQAEVFSLNDLFAAAIVFVCVLWAADPRRWRLIVPLAALFGFGLSNHQSLVLLAPLPLWPLYCSRNVIRGDPQASLVIAASAVLAPIAFMLPYVHTLAASEALRGWHFGAARTLAELRDLIERRAYGGFNLVPRAEDQGGNVFDRLIAFASADGWPLAVMLAGAAVALLQRRRESVLALLIVLFPLVAFCAIANIAVADPLLRATFQRFGLLSLTALAPFAAYMVLRFEWIGVGVALVAACFTLPKLSLANAHGPRVLFEDISQALPARAILVTAGDPVDQPPVYFQRIEHWRRDVTVVAYGLLDLRAYVVALRESMAVPDAVGLPYAPQARRDLLAYANRERPFYTTGERAIHAPGPRYHPDVYGVVSRMVENGSHSDLARRFRIETALESAPGYGDVPSDRWWTNGFGSSVREYYAGGFFSAGYDAELLGNRIAAKYWYERAREYFNDPMIAARIKALNR
ncbi:MAG: DUF2723 domain-containing protein [Candidatus Eremiobacteraeota bacterium]|nr:DUF2723 domain-containing protein [Candidatus Eremiobacteraeota bacterium]